MYAAFNDALVRFPLFGAHRGLAHDSAVSHAFSSAIDVVWSGETRKERRSWQRRLRVGPYLIRGWYHSLCACLNKTRHQAWHFITIDFSDLPERSESAPWR